jgi:hypothetical protein
MSWDLMDDEYNIIGAALNRLLVFPVWVSEIKIYV